MIPHLLHIGFPKTGSMFLRQWFADHPEIAYAESGFGGFQSVTHLSGAATGVDMPRCRVTSSEQFSTPPVRAGATIDYAGTEHQVLRARAEVCRTLADLFPNAWVLIVTRGFLAMSLSSYSQYVRTGGDQSLAGDLLQAAPERYEIWNYDAIVAQYRAHFAADRVIALPYELLRDDPTAFVGAIESRLGLSHRPPNPTVVNRSLTGVELRWYPRLTRLVRRLPLGRRFRSALLRRYLRLVFVNRPAPLIRLLQAVIPAEPIDEATFAPQLDGFRGMASRLCEEPFYGVYRAQYLADDRPVGSRPAGQESEFTQQFD